MTDENNLDKKNIEEVEAEREKFLEEQNKKIPHEQIEDELQEVEAEKVSGTKSQDLSSKNRERKGEGSFKPMLIIMLLSLVIAGFWDKMPIIKNSVHWALNPTAGWLLTWNLNWGMLVIVLIITIITTLVQKYATDQDTLRELKKESKEIQKQMKEFKNHPEKMMELQKKQFALMPKQMKLSMRGIAYTGIPFILFFRWFNDYFAAAGNPRFILGMSWFLFYLISAIIIGSILRKWWDVV